MYITAYSAICEGRLGRLPVEESIESLYPYVDEFLIIDCSKYDKIDLSKYGKVRRHIKTLWNPFDGPFTSMFNQALKYCDSDTLLFLDLDELWDVKGGDLRNIIKQFPLDQGAGIAFSLKNYYCDRNHVLDGCSSKGAHIFRNREDLYHDFIGGLWSQHSSIRRTNNSPDIQDGVRLVNGQGEPLPHWQPLPHDVCTIHHTSHLDPIGKQVRSIIQYNHTATIDLPQFSPFDMRVKPSVIEKIYKIGEEQISSGDIELYGDPIPVEYEPFELLDKFVERVGIKEFDPTTVSDYARAHQEYAKKDNDNCAVENS
jgi:hypothetical protein